MPTGTNFASGLVTAPLMAEYDDTPADAPDKMVALALSAVLDEKILLRGGQS